MKNSNTIYDTYQFEIKSILLYKLKSCYILLVANADHHMYCNVHVITLLGYNHQIKGYMLLEYTVDSLKFPQN